MALLLLAEGLALAVRFDTASLLALRDHSWAHPFAYLSEVPRLAIAVATAVLLLGGRKLSALLHRASTEQPWQGPSWPYFLLHALALVAFGLLTERVLEGPQQAVPGWVVPWVATGLLTVLFVAPVVVPRRAWGALARAAAPLILLSVAVGLAAWGAGTASARMSGPLQRWTALAVFRFLELFRPDAFLAEEEFLVGTPRFEVPIAPECSGYEGVGLIVVFLSIFLWSQRATLRFPMALGLVPVGAAVAWLANVGRLTLLVLLGEVSPSVAAGGFHSYAGAVLFSAIALVAAYAAQRLPWLSVTRPRGAGDPLGTATADAFLAPFLVLLSATLVTGLFAAGEIDPLYGVRVIAAAGTLWFFRDRIVVARACPGCRAPAIGLAVAATWLIVTPPDPERTLAFEDAATETPTPLVIGWLLLRVLGSVVIVPLVEELAFRGYLLRRLVSRDFAAVDYRSVWSWPVAISSLLFGLMHTQIVAGTLAGVAYALAARRGGGLLDAVIAHATTNAALIVYALATRQWSAWL